MRASRLLALSAVVAALAGAGLGQAVSGAGERDRPTVVRTDAPQRGAAMARSTLEVTMQPLEVPTGELRPPGQVEVMVVVRNPNATPVSGLRVSIRTSGPACGWLEGPFPDPFGLSPGGSTERTCRLHLDGPGTARLEATVLQGSASVADGALDVVGTVAPPMEEVAEAPAPAAAAPTPAPAPPSTAAPCPRLVATAPTDGSVWADRLGSGLEARATGLDLTACPAWAAMSGLRAVRHDTGEPCPPWLVWLAGSAEPSARLSMPHSTPPCPAAPLEVEVFGQSTAVAAMVTALAAWAVDPEPQRAPALHGAASGTGPAACDGIALVAVVNPYEQAGSSGPWYRATITPC